MFDDFELIEASFASQYGIRLEREYDMSWDEFFNLLSGLTHESPLGLVVSIRAEEDKDRLGGFNKDQLRMRSDYRRKIDNQLVQSMSEEDREKSNKEIQALLKTMFS